MDNKEQTLQILSNATGTNTELLNIKVSPGIGDIVVQLDVFNEQNGKPKTTRQSSTESINLNSHLDIFQAIMHQVTNTPNERTFLIILQHLLRIDPSAALCEIIWNVVEKLVHRASQLESSEESDRLINSSITHKFSCQKCRTEVIDNEHTIVGKMELEISSLPPSSHTIASSPSSGLKSTPPVGIPPPAPAAPMLPPPPPPPPLTAQGLPPPPPPPIQGRIPPFPPPNPLTQSNNLLLPQQNAPRASRKLKTFNWAKIPPHKIMNKLNIWTIMANDRQYKCVELIDFKGIEGLFALQTTNTKTKGSDVVDGVPPGDKKEKEPKHIHLLDAQRSLKVNIFLSQFKGYSSEDIVQLIRTGDCKIMNLERLKDLKKFFENEDEITILKNFLGDRQRLASAEKFLIAMLEVPNFKLRIDSMILKEEFQLNATYLEPCLNDIINAGNSNALNTFETACYRLQYVKNLMKNKTLQEILSIIIVIGNFLNSGGYAGNAAGIKLSSLTKLTEIKANKTGMHLLHLIALEVQRYNPELLNLSNELNFLENVSKINIDQIEKDIKDMGIALDSIKQQIHSPTTDEDIKYQMDEFIKKAECKMEILKRQTEELKSLRITMADFFCEDLNTFKVDECFEIFHKFCEQFKQALKENDKRQKLEIQASIRQKQKEEKLAHEALTAQTKPNANFPSKRLCSRSSREGMESNNTNLDINAKKNEDDLMAFLQNSNRKRNREKEIVRKPRLDKRPDLLKFNFERERDQQSPNFVESTNSNGNTPTSFESIATTPCLEEQRKTNLLQKSWKRLMEGYKASQLRDKCFTPDIAPKRESLQIFIRSNSTVDNAGDQSNKPPLIKIIKTPLVKSSTVFNFSPLEIQASQAGVTSPLIESIEEKNVNSMNDKKISPLEISEHKEISNEINTAIPPEESSFEKRNPKLKLKTMASIVQLGCRYSSINEEDLKTTIKKLRTPTLEKSQFCFSPTTLKSNNWSWDQRQQVLNSVDEENTNQDLNENIKDNSYEQQQSQNENPAVEVEEEHLKSITSVKSGTNKKIEKEMDTSCEGQSELIASVDKNEKTIDQINLKENFSKRLVTKLQETIRALSPIRIPENEKQEENITLNNELKQELINETGDLRNLKRSSSSETIDKICISVTSPSIESEKEKTNNLKKSFVNRLQSKIRALSPLKSKAEQKQNFQSYVHFEKTEKNVKTEKTTAFVEHKINQKKQDDLNSIVAKENIAKEHISYKDNKTQLRVSRISYCSTETNNNSNDFQGPANIKTPLKNFQRESRSLITVQPVVSRICLKSSKITQKKLNVTKAGQSVKLTQNKINQKKPHCQAVSPSTSSKQSKANLRKPQSKTSSKPSTSLETRRQSLQSNKNSAIKQSEDSKLNTFKSGQIRLSVTHNSSNKNDKKDTTTSTCTIPSSLSQNKRSMLKPLSSKSSSNKNLSSSAKSSESITNIKQKLSNSSNSLNRNNNTPKSIVKKSNMQLNLSTRSSQNAEKNSSIGTSSSSDSNDKKLTFAEICQRNKNSPPNSNLDQTLTRARNSASKNVRSKSVVNSVITSAQTTTTSPEKVHQNFKRPCKKF